MGVKNKKKAKYISIDQGMKGTLNLLLYRSELEREREKIGKEEESNLLKWNRCLFPTWIE